MGSIGGGELPNMNKMQIPVAREERILVLVRLRPLNEKEIVANEVADWECINDTTILYRNTLREGSSFPSAYSFDRVFRGDSSTRQVYNDAVKEVALSVVSGINSSIFAYGQTSSGKTYTMMGITEYAVADIFDYMHRHEERAYILKFSAIEIYNEAIRDLLSTDSTPLRLLDDPEKGTIVEKVTEETLKDWNHLQELLSVCEAQRRIGETLLNEKSSRSHQILRLTIESSAREFLGIENSTTLAATVNFVDLAGSERASQSLSSGTRLKEGCHINRSLLTLGTVIRKLSKGRNGHINYRDSKLTRLLQPALGGNARTSVICTLSPAHSHVEQTRNTLLFACCAKEVTTKAQVNVVMSDKELVKHLQRELARLESELNRPAPNSSSPSSDYAALLRKRDLQIEKMEKEIRELTKQRDLTESRIQDLLKMIGNDLTSSGMDTPHHSQRNGESWERDSSASESSGVSFRPYIGKSAENSNTNMYGDSGHNTRKPYYLEDNMKAHSLSNTSSPILTGKKITVSAEDADIYCKEVRCIEMDEARRENHIKPNSLSNGEILQMTIDSLVTPDPNETSLKSSVANMTNSRSIDTKSSSSRESSMSESPLDLEREDEFESTLPSSFEFAGRPKSGRRKFAPLDYGIDTPRLTRNDSHSSLGSAYTDDMGSLSVKISAEENIPSVQTFVEGLKEMAMQATGSTASFEKSAKDVGLDPICEPMDTSVDWPLVFERQRKEIIELWHACNVSVVHRTYFYLLFKGESSDSIYMEVELRRLHFLKETLSQGSRSGGGGQAITLASSNSMKALHRERGMLTKLMQKRLSENERKAIYQRWGIGLKSKQRRAQLANRLWTNTQDISHIAESAAIVAKLVRFVQQGQALKEMFGLSFAPPSTTRRRSLGWSHISSG